jgi:hypothetical protein
MFKTSTKPDMVTHTYNSSTGRLKQEDHEFKASLGYITTKKKKPKNEQTNKTKLKESHFK